jgi:hypothetical protein
MADISLGEYLAQAQRSMGGGAFGRTSGPLSGYLFGPDFFRKQTYLQIADTFVATYGKKVWDSLNNKTVTFNAIKKVDWGATVGWRNRTDRGAGRSRPVSETGALPTIDNSNYVGVYSYPRQIVTTFGVSLKGQAVSALEGGIGNQFAVEQEAASRDHIVEINQELMSEGAYLVSAGSATTFTVPASVASNFKIGDTVNWYDASGTTHRAAGATVTGVNTSTGVVTCTTLTVASEDITNGDVAYVVARNGITPIADIAMQDDATVGGAKASVMAYNYTTRTAGTYNAGALVSYNSGVARDLTLPLVDSAFQAIRQNGGEPKLIICGLDQYDKLNQLLQTQQRFMDVTDYIVGAGDERTYPGTRGGFQLATYRGIPILPDPYAPKSVSTTDAVLGSEFFVLDTDYHEMAVMYPTQYLENRDYFARMKVCGEIKSGYMLENPVYLGVLSIGWVVKISPVGTIRREDSYNEDPQRLYARHSQIENDDIVRTGWRHPEIGRNDQSLSVEDKYATKITNWESNKIGKCSCN